MKMKEIHLAKRKSSDAFGQLPIGQRLDMKN
jgi:hypothetical protein